VDTSDYNTLGDAIAAVPEGGVLVISDDIIAEPFAITKRMTIDLNGHKITINNPAANVIAAEVMLMDTDYSDPSFFEGRGTSTGGIIEKTAGEAFVVVNNGKLIVDSGNIIATSTNALRAQNGGEIVVNNGYIKAKEMAILVTGFGSNLIINNGVFETEDNCVVSGNANASSAGTSIEINGGTFYAHRFSEGFLACGVYHPQGGHLVINGGQFYVYNGVGILVRGGEVTINDINLTTIGDISGKIDNSQIINSCYDVCVDMRTEYPVSDMVQVTINGGRFVADENIESTIVLTNDETADANRLIISGGTFSKS